MTTSKTSKTSNSQTSKINSNLINMCNKYFKTFNLIPNRKEPSNEWSIKKSNTHLWKNETIDMLEDFNEPKSKGIPCGKRNDIIVIDLDFYDKYNKDGTLKKKFDYENNLFINTFGNLEKCKEIFKDTLIVETARGGLHLYFNYDPSIKTTSNDLLGIDIRSDGGYVVSMGTQIDKSFYNKGIKTNKKGIYKVVNNRTIQDIPIELAMFLKQNMWRNNRTISKPIKNNTNGDRDVAITPYEQNQIDLTAYNYDITDDELINILDGLPDKYFINNNDWIIFSTAMMTLDKRELWEKYSIKRGGDTYDKISNDTKWDYGVFKYKTFLCIEHLLCNSKYIIGEETDNKIIKDLASNYLSYYKYKPTDCHNEKADEILNDRKYLDLNNDGEFLLNQKTNPIIKSATGTGKTTAFKNYIKKTNKRFISIVSRITLGKEQVNIFKEANIQSYWHDDITNMDKELFNKMANQYGQDEIGWWAFEGDNIVITIDSIIKMTNWGDFSDYVIYLDEFNSLVEYFINCPNLDSKRIFVKQFLIKMLNECDMFIGTDADISDNSLLFLKQNDLEYKYIQNKYKHNLNKDGDVIIAKELYSYPELMENIKKLDKFMVACDSKMSAIQIHNDLLESGYDANKMICITSDTNKHIDLDDFPIVIFSPKIVYGLDSIMEREVFAYMKGHTISPTAMIQQIARCRNIIKISFLFTNKNWKPYKYDSIDECKEALESAMNNFKSQGFYNQSSNNKSEKNFNELYINFKYTDDCYNTNKFAHFLKLLKDKGYELSYEHKKSKGVSSITKKYKADKNNEFIESLNKCIEENDKLDKTEDFDEYEIMEKHMPSQWAKIIKLLDAPLNVCLDYSDIITCDKELTKYYNRVRYFINDTDYFDKLSNKNDFDIVKYSSSVNKTIFIDKIKKAIGMEDLIDFKATKVIDKLDCEKLFTEYKHIFGRYRGKGNPFTTLKGCKTILIKSYKDMFGKDIIITSQSTKINKKTKKTEKIYTYEINNEMIESTKNLSNYY